MQMSTLRVAIRAEIESIRPADDIEATHRAEALAWVDSGAQLCRVAKPATPPRHLVSYFVLVDGPLVLLVDHRNAQRWLPTGGHVEPDEHPRSTVVRELQEELGIAPAHDLQAPLMITCTETVGHTAGHWDVSLWYVLNASSSQALSYDDSEFAGVRWFHRDELPLDRTDPHLSRFARKLWEGSAA
ncbi:NUDIX hydrolase [Roseateles sp.]|uniref:NUDIX hydrolase n=1 Tax=Roseateles sp. TaxID=1971397 RepID=UPI003266BF2B